MTPQDVIDTIKEGKAVRSVPTGLMGRVVRGQEPKHFETLAGDDPSRKIVFLTDSDGLSRMFGLSTYEILVDVIGYDKPYCADLAKKPSNWPDGYNGTRFLLTVFPETSAFPATWDKTLELVREIWPELSEDTARHRPWMINPDHKGVEWYEEKAGYKFADTEKSSEEGGCPANKMTFEAYLNGDRTQAWRFRQFLYNCVYCRELYRGDGYADDGNGNQGEKEVLMPTKRIDQIDGVVAWQMDDIIIP